MSASASTVRTAARGGLATKVAEDLRRTIASGEVPVGGKLPSESTLTGTYKVSRTVVREALATLRADGLVEPRQGAGVFVIGNEPSPGGGFLRPEPKRLSSAIELLELRTAVEVESAALASLRRSPAQEEAILERCDDLDRLIAAGAATAEADRDFHLAIADATNNPRFREFLALMGSSAIPRRALQDGTAGERTPADYLVQIQAEHRAIAAAISLGDPDAAGEAMRLHLKGSQDRYRAMLRQPV